MGNFASILAGLDMSGLDFTSQVYKAAFVHNGKVQWLKAMPPDGSDEAEYTTDHAQAMLLPDGYPALIEGANDDLKVSKSHSDKLTRMEHTGTGSVFWFVHKDLTVTEAVLAEIRDNSGGGGDGGGNSTLWIIAIVAVLVVGVGAFVYMKDSKKK
jgi:hypothetical protein